MASDNLEITIAFAHMRNLVIGLLAEGSPAAAPVYNYSLQTEAAAQNSATDTHQ